MYRNRKKINTTALVFIIAISKSAAFADSKFGLKIMDESKYLSIPTAPVISRGSLPTSVDLSESFPKPGNQGQQGSCVGWAIAYALKSYQETEEHRWHPDENSFSPSYIYNQLNPTKGKDCQQGLYIEQALKLVAQQGAYFNTSFPYDPDQCYLQPTEEIISKAGRYKIASYRRVNDKDTNELKNNIANKIPIIIASKIDNNFQRWKGEKIFNNYNNNNYIGSHAMVIVGYDDKISAFKLINSWGTKWGDQGYAWVSYQTLKSMIQEGYITYDEESNLKQDPENHHKNRIEIKPAANFVKINKYQYEINVWINNLPDKIKDIESVTYTLNHESFNFDEVTKTNINESFMLQYYGWGCLKNMIVDTKLKDGSVISQSFDLCQHFAENL